MIGIDILEIERIDSSEKFLNKIAFSSEIGYIKKSKCEDLKKQRIGALFCVKEAVIKACNLTDNSLESMKEIELCHEKSGKPYIVLHGKLKEKFDKNFKGKKIEVSLSHTKLVATAVAVII